MKRQTLSTVLQWCSIGAAAGAAALQSLAMLTAYAMDRNYFAQSTPLPTLAALLAVLAGVLGILSSIFSEKEKLLHPIADSFLIGIPAAAGLGYGAYRLLSSSTSTLAIVTAILMLGAALYSLLLCEANARRFPRALMLFGFLAVAACAAINVYCYFDASLEMNAPVKVTLQTGLLFAMLYYTAEIRFLLGRAKPRLYLSLAYCTVASLALAAVSVYVAYNNGVIDRADYYAFAIASLGILANVLLRLLCYTGVLTQDPPQEEDVTAEDGEYATEAGEAEESEASEASEKSEETDTPEEDSTEEKETDEE